MNASYIICGVGGQGTVLASRLIGSAAMAMGLDIRTTETIGMAQRGGTVVSHVRIGHDIHSPLVPLKGADGIIAFEAGEAVRLMPFLKDGGKMIVADSIIPPVTSALDGSNYEANTMLTFLKDNIEALLVADTAGLIKTCGSLKVLNVYLLSAAVAWGIFPFGKEGLLSAIEERIPAKFVVLNKKAYAMGIDFYNNIKGGCGN